MKRIIAAYQWHVFRDDCTNGCLRVAQTIAVGRVPLQRDRAVTTAETPSLQPSERIKVEISKNRIYYRLIIICLIEPARILGIRSNIGAIR